MTFEKESCEAILLGIRPLAGSALLPFKSQRSKENVPSSFSMEKKIGHELGNVLGFFFPGGFLIQNRLNRIFFLQNAAKGLMKENEGK